MEEVEDPHRVDVETSFGQRGQFISEKNMKEEALERTPKTIMDQLLQTLILDETFFTYLSGHNLMNNSSTRQTSNQEYGVVHNIFLENFQV